jgi:hypothetical protein
MSKWTKWLVASAVVTVVLACASPRSAEANWRRWWGPSAYGGWVYPGVNYQPNFAYPNKRMVLMIQNPGFQGLPAIPGRSPHGMYYNFGDPRSPYAGYYFHPH